MPFNINSFKSVVQKTGYLPTSKFELYLAPPKILQNGNTNRIIKEHVYRVEQVRAPGINIQVVDNAIYGIGTVQKFPVNAQYNDFSFEIYSDGYGQIWQFWHNWLNTIFNFTSTENAGNGSAFKYATYTAKYKEEYATTMQLKIYDNFGNEIQDFNLYEAFPVSLREVPLSWSQPNDMIKLTVGVSYKEHTVKTFFNALAQ